MSRTSTPRSRSPSTSSDSSDTTMLDAPVALSPARPRQPSVTQRAPASPPPAAATAAAASSFSLLLSLPRELRDRVYAFALASPYPFWWPGQAPVKHHVGPALLATSKQVHAEAAPVLYAANKFLFTHPSDCNVFRVVASPAAARITSVYLRIREKDLRLWTAYLGSKSPHRSLRADLPRLGALCIFLRCASPPTPRLLSTLGLAPPAMAVHVQAVQTALGQQVAALQQHVQLLAAPQPVHLAAHHPANAHLANTHLVHPANPTNLPHHVPPPPPPPPAMPFAAFAATTATTTTTTPVPHHHPQPPAAHPHPNHHILATFLRFERELGIESLCLSLRDTLDPDHQPHPARAGGHRERRRRNHEDPEIPDPETPDPEDPEHPKDPDITKHPENTKDPDDPKDTPTKKDSPDVKIVCIMRIPKPEVTRLVRMYPDELTLDRNGDARTRFRRLHGADICLEISGFDGVQ